jgi:F-type H+-transporting ATPase subunit b
VKKIFSRSLLAGLALTLVLGVGFNLHGTRALAQDPAAASATNPQATSNDSVKNSDSAKSDQSSDEMDAYRKSPNVIALGKKLGLSPDQAAVAFDVANFLVLAVGVCWLIAKILPKTLRERNETIQKDLVDARTATEEARARLSGVEERLSKLDGEIAALRTRSEQESAAEEQRIKATVEDEKKKILASAEQEIAAATSHAQKQLQQYAAGLAIEQAARKLVVSAETDRLLVQGFAQKLTGDGTKKGQN